MNILKRGEPGTPIFFFVFSFLYEMEKEKKKTLLMHAKLPLKSIFRQVVVVVFVS
jgi:hypothetical protein